MATTRIVTWQERLKACFQLRQRLLHVFGVPSAVGALGAVAASAMLNPEAGLALGALTAGTGMVLAGYYVVAGFDRRLIALLEQEEQGRAKQLEESEESRVLSDSEPVLRAQLERCLELYSAIEGVFGDGIDDSVEAVLQNARADLKAMRARAISMVKLHQRLNLVVQKSNADALVADVRRMDRDLAHTPEGAVRDALLAARQSSVRTLEQWQGAFEKRSQVKSVLTLIENSLQEFKLAMELRKADDALGAVTSGQGVSELQARLIAAGEACDELVGRTSITSERRASRRRVS